MLTPPVCLQAILAKEAEEAQFVLEGFQIPTMGVRPHAKPEWA